MFSNKDSDPYSLMEEGVLSSSNAGAFYDKQVRQGFIRKVFGILAVQLLFTTLTCATFMASSGVKAYMQANPWPLWTSLVVSFVVLIAMMCKPELSRTFPTNYTLLGIFTAAEAVMVGSICMVSDTQAVVLAAGITTVVVASLTAYALQTKRDFTTAGGILLSCLMALLVTSIVAMFFPSYKPLEIMMSGAGALLFGCYLVVDIQMLMAGKSVQISPDDYVLAAINIYLDILNLFLYILRIINAADRN